MPAGKGPPIPVTVLGGYLGAGKTTLVNHLLRNAQGRRLAVLVNDFGALPIDAELIEGDEENGLISLAGGCVCCSYGSDLMDALATLPQRAGRPDRVVIEASGVALPGNVAGAVTLLGDYRMDAVVVLADADNIVSRAADRYVGDTVARQLADADLVHITKSDLVDTEQLAGVQALVGRLAPSAVTVVAPAAAIDPAVILDFAVDEGPGRAAARGASTTTPESAAAHLDGLVTAHWHPADEVDVEALVERLTDPASGVLRAKGFVIGAGGALRCVQVVGRRADVTPAPAGARPGLVCIAREERFDPGGLDAIVGVHGHRDAAVVR